MFSPLIEIKCVLFPRCGDWAGAVLKFRIELPMSYPLKLNDDLNEAFPEVVFD